MPSLVFGCKQGFWHLMDRLKKSLPRRTHKHASPFISEFTKTMLQSAKDPQHPGALASHCFRFAIPMAVPTAVPTRSDPDLWRAPRPPTQRTAPLRPRMFWRLSLLPCSRSR